MLSRRFWNIAATAILTVCGARGETPSDVMRLPAPTGRYGVGHTDHLWIDTSRAAREIVLRVWYPTDGDVAQGVPWLERFEQAKAVLGETALRKAFRFGYPAVAAGSLRIHSSPGTPIAQRPGRFPVIVFSPGFGTPGLAYSIQLEDLASHGYIVASVTRPPASSLTVFPDGRVTTMAPETQSHMERNETARLTAWTLDVQFVLHQLLDDVQTGHAAPWRGRVEASAVGVFGHSLGGRVSAEACLKDSRIKACLDQDGMLPGGLPFSPKGDRHPLKAAFLLMTTSTSTRMPTADELARMNQTQSQFEEMLRELQRARSRLFANIHGGSHRLVLDVPGISHQSFSDLPFVAAFTSQDRRNAQRVLDVTRTCVVAFFDQYLRNSTVSLKERAAVLPEIRAEHFTANDH